MQPSEGKVSQAEREHFALSRLMQWCFRLDNTRKHIASTGPAEFDSYTPLVTHQVIARCLQDGVLWNPDPDVSPEAVFFDEGFMPIVFIHLYFAELHYHPWGLASMHQISQQFEQSERTLKLFKLPNFLLPLDCLYCGKPLEYTSYGETSKKKTKHEEQCADAWEKRVRKKHIQALDALYSQGADKVELHHLLWESYIELAALYVREYRPRFQLIEAYQNIPTISWLKPLWALGEQNKLLQLPFIQPAIKDYDLSLSQDIDTGVEIQRNPKRMVVTLHELDKYFIAKP